MMFNTQKGIKERKGWGWKKNVSFCPMTCLTSCMQYWLQVYFLPAFLFHNYSFNGTLNKGLFPLKMPKATST